MKALRILAIEGNSFDLFLVRTALDESAIDYNLAAVPDGEAAISLLRTVGQPDGETARTWCC